MKILILDDQPERHEGFKKILSDHELTHVWTYTEAILAFRREKFDMAYLDHDLGDMGKKVVVKSVSFDLTYKPDFYEGGMYGSSSTFYDGADVAVWLMQNSGHCPPKILIHSWNGTGAENMRRILSPLFNVEVRVKPFKVP